MRLETFSGSLGLQLAALGLASATALACQSQSSGGVSSEGAGTSAQPAQTSAPARAAEEEHEDFDAKAFSRPTVVDNAYIPMKPGTRYTYEGTTIEDDGTAVPHRVVINVTDLTKVIGGVRSVVTWDLDYSDNQLVE
ncbi:MAG TPA: hypothetical protein VKA01_08740, partial [Vicinamibacteria bacterium]|nr:hypothetical protein [Vicinamibacteria bacterium]